MIGAFKFFRFISGLVVSKNVFLIDIRKVKEKPFSKVKYKGKLTAERTGLRLRIKKQAKIICQSLFKIFKPIRRVQKYLNRSVFQTFFVKMLNKKLKSH